jgi:hypothetical protein
MFRYEPLLLSFPVPFLITWWSRAFQVVKEISN